MAASAQDVCSCTASSVRVEQGRGVKQSDVFAKIWPPGAPFPAAAPWIGALVTRDVAEEKVAAASTTSGVSSPMVATSGCPPLGWGDKLEEFNSNITWEMCSSSWAMLLLSIMANMLCFEACVGNGGRDYYVEWVTVGGACYALCHCKFDCAPEPPGGDQPYPGPGTEIPWTGGHPFDCTDLDRDGKDDITGSACS